MRKLEKLSLTFYWLLKRPFEIKGIDFVAFPANWAVPDMLPAINAFALLEAI